MKCAEVANNPSLDHFPTRGFKFAQEFLRLWTLARYRLSSGTRPSLGLAAALATAVVAIFLHFHILRPELWRSGNVYAALPLTSELARLPMSLFFPTPYLPLWAACAQLLVVLGLGELVLGRWLTIVVASIGHIGSTLVARVLLESVHGHVIGLTPVLARVLDTGPSAATTAVGACLLVTAKMNRCALLLGVGLIAAALLAPGIDGVEHTTAFVLGITAGVVNCTVVANINGSHNVSSSGLRSVKFAWILRAFASLRLAVTGPRNKV